MLLVNCHCFVVQLLMNIHPSVFILKAKYKLITIAISTCQGIVADISVDCSDYILLILYILNIFQY